MIYFCIQRRERTSKPCVFANPYRKTLHCDAKCTEKSACSGEQSAPIPSAPLPLPSRRLRRRRLRRSLSLSFSRKICLRERTYFYAVHIVLKRVSSLRIECVVTQFSVSDCRANMEQTFVTVKSMIKVLGPKAMQLSCFCVFDVNAVANGRVAKQHSAVANERVAKQHR